MGKPVVFISYSAQDRETAETFHTVLESGGFQVWRDITRLKIGHNWSRSIARGLADSDVICLIWSEHSAQSEWVKHEWLTGRALEKMIIPCLFPKAPRLPEPLFNLQAIVLMTESKSALMQATNVLIHRLHAIDTFRVHYDYTILPSNSYIPFNPNPHFTGRHTDLLNLYLNMVGNLNKIGLNQVGTVGMGGIGKTQLAVEFAYRFSFAFARVYWISAGNPNLWLREFVAIARDRLLIEVGEEEENRERRYLLQMEEFFKQRSDDKHGTLIVMDNIEDPALLYSEQPLSSGITPLTLGCDLLFTTRRRFTLPGVLSQPVDVISANAAYMVLTSEREPDTPEEQSSAFAICNAVGYLPLALVLAGKYLAKYRAVCSFSKYHSVLVENKLGTIDLSGSRPEELATRHVTAVGLTLKQQWAMLDSDDAKHLFELAGLFPEATIIAKASLGVLAGIVLERETLVFPLENAILTLRELSLIEEMERGEAVRLHPLVRDFALRLIPEEEQKALRNRAIANLKALYWQPSPADEGYSRTNMSLKRFLTYLQSAIILCRDDRDTVAELVLVHTMLNDFFNKLSVRRAFELAESALRTKRSFRNLQTEP